MFAEKLRIDRVDSLSLFLNAAPKVKITFDSLSDSGFNLIESGIDWGLGRIPGGLAARILVYHRTLKFKFTCGANYISVFRWKWVWLEVNNIISLAGFNFS